MRLVAWTLIIVSLVVALVSAVSAYSVDLSRPAEQLRTSGGDPLTLAAPAGVQVVDGEAQPIGKPNDLLTPQLVERLRASKQQRVRVQEFSLARWNEWWIFALGCLGMLGGARLVRRETARQLVMGQGESSAHENAETALRSLRLDLETLRREVAASADPEVRMSLVVRDGERMTAQHVPPFLAARPVLVSRLGLAGYAQLMDRFAAAERQLNRAWSAAADGYEQEAVNCLENAAELLDDAAQKLAAGGATMASPTVAG